MHDISYSSSKPTIIPGTEQPCKSEIAPKQLIEIPSFWLKSRCGGHRVIKRDVLVAGTVEIKMYNSIYRVRYGTMLFNNWTVTVLEDSTRWLAIDKVPIDKK